MVCGIREHTPGPLEVWGQQLQSEIGGFYTVGRAGKKGGCLAYVAWREDALLYSAAPDLLACARATKLALDDEFSITDKCDDEWLYDELGSLMSSVYFAARAAIAKAEGLTKLADAPKKSPVEAEPVAFMASDRMRAITQQELDTLPSSNGRRDHCKAMYAIPLYASPPALLDKAVEVLEKISNCGQSAEPDHWKFRCMARDTARAALSDIKGR